VAIGDFEYDVTVKFDDEYPTIYNYKNNYSYDGDLRIALQYGDLSDVKINGKQTNAPDGKALSVQTFAGGASKPALDKNLLAIGTYANAGLEGMKDFQWKESDHLDGMTFNVSTGATVYVLSVNKTKTGSENLEKLNYAKVGTINGYPLYAKHFNAGDAVSIPTEPVTQAELNVENNDKTDKFIFVDDTNKSLPIIPGISTADSITLKNLNSYVGLPVLFQMEDGVPVAAYESESRKNKPNTYERAQSTIFYVEFDKPLALGEVTYSVDGGDADAITFAEGKFTKNIEVPYDTTTVSVAATKTGTGTVTVEPAELDLTGVASGKATVTLTAPGGTPVVYTINFVKGAPKISWESALALTGTPKTQNQGANRSLHKDGLYNVGAQSGSLELTASKLNLVVPYGVEVVKLNDDVSVNLLAAENHTATEEVTVDGTVYTVTVSWDAYAYTAGMPLLYDLEYGVTGVYNTSTKVVDEFDKTGLYDTKWYYAIPTPLVLDADHDLVLGTGDLLGTKADGTDRETITLTVEEGTWFTSESHKSVNLTSTSAGAGLNRLHLAPSAFESWVENGDIDDIYALNGATMLVADYTDVVADNAVRYKFKTAQAGYVIVACRSANSALTAADGWTLLDGNTMAFTNASTTARNNQLAMPPIIDGVEYVNAATSYAILDGSCDNIYIKKVAANEAIEIKESDVATLYPPVVIVATEDMINERVYEDPVLAPMTYTIGDGEAQAIEFADGATEATRTLPWGTTDAITVQAKLESGDGNVSVSDAITLSKDASEGVITVTVKNAYEEVVGTYTINFVWGAAPVVEENKYGTIEVYPREGLGTVIGYTGDDPDDPDALVYEGIERYTINEAAGTIVTFSATPAEGYEFLYWALVDAGGKVTTAYEYASEFKMNVGYGLRIKAVFATDNPDVYTVTFKGWQNNIIERFTVEKDAEGSFNTPYAPNVYGYKFDHYEAEGWINTYEENVEIPENMIAGDVTFVAKYVPDEIEPYTVYVTNGTVDGVESKDFAYNTSVTVIANKAEAGMKFSCWTEDDTLENKGTIVSYDAEYDFYMASADRNLFANYVAEDQAVAQAPVVTMTVTTVDDNAEAPIYGLFAERRVPEAYTVVENGIVWGTATDDEDADLITLTKDGEHRRGASASKYQNNNGQYTVRLQMTESRQGKGDKWYARTYLIYNDAGTIRTMYSAPALVWEKAAVAE
ncbi:MAG: hypothetical protein IJD83_08510, partial [Clostridia bacterium]|nr:hypothetical protein [Clostridia bacterium]